MKYTWTFILIISYSFIHVASTSSHISSISSSTINLSDKPSISSAQICSPIIEQQFIGFDFSCIDGCVVLKNSQSITLASLILSDIETTITTCISFSDIEKVEIDTLTLSNLVIEIDQSSSNFIIFSNIGSLNISNLSISKIAKQSPSSVVTAIYIDSSVLSQTFQSVYLSSQSNKISSKPSTPTYLFYLLLNSNARIINVSTLQIVDCFDQSNFSTISTITIDKIIYQQALTLYLAQDLFKPTLELRAEISITVNSIQIVDKRDPYQKLNKDLLFTAVIKNEFQTKISIGSIQRNIENISSESIQFSQTSFIISLYRVRSSGQTLNPNLDIDNISVSMISFDQVSQNQPNSSILFDIYSYNIIKINQVVLSDYTRKFIHISSSFSIYIGLLQVTASQSSSSQNNYSIIKENLIDASSINSITFDKIILQNAAIINTVYLTFESIQIYIIKSILIEQLVFISSQFLNVAESTSIQISNSQILNSVVRASISSQNSSPIFTITNTENIEFNDFVMKSLNLNVKWIESLDSNPLTRSQSVMISNNCSSHTFTDIHVDFLGFKLGFFSSHDFNQNLVLSNSTFNNCYSQLGGGCLAFNLQGNLMDLNEPRLYLSNVTFFGASSGYFGGAIFGSQLISAIDVRFESCSSLIGGGLFLKGTSSLDALANITFVNNVADIASPDFCYGIDKVKKGLVLEYNPSLQGTPLYLNPIGKYSDQIQFYAGILYVYELEFLIDGNWYTTIPRSRTASNQNNQELLNEGNLFPFVTKYKLLYNSIIIGETNFYILYDPTNSYSTDVTNVDIGFTFTRFYMNSIQLDYSSSANCKEGMEEIMFSNGLNHICQYCGLSKAIYPTNSICQTCDITYFKTCYSNQTELNIGYWRSNYTINTTLIETCSISMSSCNGGYGIGNSLCYEGHIGPQCLNCDIRGEYWGESYSMQGVYTCNKCSDINSNEIKIILGLALISLSLLVIIKGNFKATKNQIYADYLAKIKMIYIGSSLSRLQQMSTCLKVLLFNLFFSNLINSFTQLRVWKSLSETSVILNQPLVSQFFSIDCFLINQFSTSLNIGFANLMISIATPGVIFSAHLALGVIMLLANKFQKKKMETRTVVSSLILSFTYLFLIVFYPFIFQLCLKSFYCIRLEGTRTFSQIDLSLECGDSSNKSLEEIHALATPALCLIIIFMPLAILLFLYYRKTKLRTVSMMLTFGFIYREYKNQFYLWEFARIILKSVCVFTQVALVGNPQLYGIIIALLLTIYLVTLIFKQPFQGILFNRLEQISVSIQILSVLSAVLYEQYELNQIQNGTLIEILFFGSQILNVIFILCLSLLIIFSFSQKQLIKLHRKWKIPYAERFLPLYSRQLRNNFKRLRSLISKFQGRVHSVNIDELQNLLFHEQYEQEEDQYEITDSEEKEAIYQYEFNDDQINTETFLRKN